jgi:flagellar motility protein MotE (MotC chaperone)
MVHNGWIFTSPAGNLLHLAPDPDPAHTARTQRQVNDFISKSYTFTRGPVANTFVQKPETGKLRPNVESTSTGHFNTPEQCNKVIGTQDADQRCSICGRQREYPSETFSCEHSLEVLLLAICCSLTPSIGDDTILENIYEFLKAINAYTWCCLRCNELKAKIQKKTGVFIGVGLDTSGKIIFGRDNNAINEYIDILPSWNSHWFPGTKPYYATNITSLQHDSKTRIYNIIDPLIFALNNIYITSIWGTFQNMMLFGIIKIIAMMGRIYCYPRSTESSGGGRVMNNLTNPKIKYNMKGGVVNIKESVTLITAKGGIPNILGMINYYTLNCTLLTHFDELVNIVIKLQRWVRRVRETIMEREEITNHDKEFVLSDYSSSSPEDIDHVIKAVKSKIIEKLQEKLQMYIHAIKNRKLTQDGRDEIIYFIKSFDEDEQAGIIKQMIDSGITLGDLSQLFLGERNLEQILQELEKDEEYQHVQQVVVDPYQANTDIHQLIHKQLEIQQEINSHQRQFFTTPTPEVRQSMTDKNSELQAIVVQQSNIIKELDPAIAAQILTGIPPIITAQILTKIHPNKTAQILTKIRHDITEQILELLDSSYRRLLPFQHHHYGGTSKRKTIRRKSKRRKSKRRRNNKKRSRK